MTQKLNNKYYFNKTILAFYYVLSLALLSGFRAFGKGSDYNVYANIFMNIHNRRTLEPFYVLFYKINDLLFSSSIFSIFFINTLIALTIRVVAFKYLCKTYSSFLFSLVFHFFTFFFIHDYVQIRASLAIAIFLWSIKDIVEKRFFIYCIKTSLAVTCHSTAIIMLLFYIFCIIFNKRRSILFLVLSIFIFSILANKLTIMKKIEEIVVFLISSSEIDKGYRGKTIITTFNLKYLALLGLYVFLYFFIDKRDKINIVLFKSFGFGLALFYFFIALGFRIAAVRFAEFYTCVFIVLLANNIRNIKIKEKLILYCISCIFILFYFYATIRQIGILK